MPKKRSKGSKLARMSDEERLRYLQYRAEVELEAQRRKQQLIATFTKNKLKREEGFSRLNTAKINEQWRYILRQIKCKELHEDVEYLSTNFDRLTKAKDEIIRRLYKELEIADQDHRRLQIAHMEMIDDMIGKHKRKLISLHDFYMKQLDNVKSKDIVELDSLKKDMEQSCREMLSIIAAKGEQWADKLSTRKMQCFENIHNIIYIKDDMTTDLIQKTSNKMETLWEELNEVLDRYETTTKVKRKQYEYLKEQDDFHKVETAEFPETHLQLQNTIDCLKSNIDTLLEKREKHISQLKATAKQMKERTDRIKEQASLSQTVHSARLKRLIVTSTGSLKHLESLADKGTIITQFIKICSNVEPLTIGFKNYILQQTVGFELSRTRNPTEVFDKLDNFWEQFNHVKADNILLKKELHELSDENKQLKRRLHTYLLGISGSLVTHSVTTISL